MIQRRIAKRRAWFREMAQAAGVRDAGALAEQLDVLFDGALASGVKREDTQPAQAALRAARTLLDVACGSQFAAAS